MLLPCVRRSVGVRAYSLIVKVFVVAFFVFSKACFYISISILTFQYFHVLLCCNFIKLHIYFHTHRIC